MYRLEDLTLVRDNSQALTRSWTVMHVIDASSPLYGMTPEGLQASEMEFLASVVGTDDTSLQPVHARHRDAQHLDRIAPLVRGVGIRKEFADVARVCRAKNGVGERVTNRVAVGMRDGVYLTRDVDATQTQWTALCVPMRVIPDADAHGKSDVLR